MIQARMKKQILRLIDFLTLLARDDIEKIRPCYSAGQSYSSLNQKCRQAQRTRYF